MIEEYQEILEEAHEGQALLKKRLKILSTRTARLKDVLKLSHLLHDEVFEKIDCMQCANCCRELGPRILTPDVAPLAKALGMKPMAFERQYLALDDEEQMVFSTLPCPFLDGNACTVYDDRPRSCQDYPHTADRDIHKRLYRLGLDSQYCPAAWIIANKLVDHFGV